MTRMECVDARRRLQPGKASDYIDQCNLGPGEAAVLCCRVSGHEQGRKGNLQNQEDRLRHEMKRRDVTIAGVVSKVWSGNDPVWLARAVELAERHRAVIVAETTDRFIRSSSYQNTNQAMQARIIELETLLEVAAGIPLLTVVHPDATPEEVRSWQSKRGQWAKARKGGRPSGKHPGYKKRKRERLLPRAMKLHADGASLREISLQLGISKSTAQGWISRYA